jgi:hypothetical protein
MGNSNSCKSGLILTDNQIALLQESNKKCNLNLSQLNTTLPLTAASNSNTCKVPLSNAQSELANLQAQLITLKNTSCNQLQPIKSQPIKSQPINPQTIKPQPIISQPI